MCVCVRAQYSPTVCDHTDSSPPIIVVLSPSCVRLCDTMDCSMPGFLVLHSLGVCSNAWHIPKRDPKLIGLICKEKLGRFSENPDKFRDEFVRLGLAVSFMWQDIMAILAHLE